MRHNRARNKKLIRHIAAVKKELATLPIDNLNQKVLEKKKSLYNLIKSVRKNTHQGT
jgi:hypothetical protein